MSTSSTLLATLLATYNAEVDALIARYPMQAANRPHYDAMAKGATVAILRKAIRTKGRLTDAPKGAAVLLLNEDNARISADAGFPVATIFVPAQRCGLAVSAVRARDLQVA